MFRDICANRTLNESELPLQIRNFSFNQQFSSPLDMRRFVRGSLGNPQLLFQALDFFFMDLLHFVHRSLGCPQLLFEVLDVAIIWG